MKILFINPNSTESMTDKVRETARAVLPDNVEVVAVSNADGPESIQGPDDGNAAIPGMPAEIKRSLNDGVDGIVIACFDDTGLANARALTSVPVLCIGHAAYQASMLLGLRFSVVTTLSVSVPVLESNIRQFGCTDYCCKVRASEVPVLDLEKPGSEAQERVSREIATAIREDNCESIVLGCAGMTDLAAKMSTAHQLPVIDGVAASSGLIYGLALYSTIQ